MLEPSRITELMEEEHSRSVKRGMRLKAEAGGITGQAPLGYVNVREGSATWVETDPVAGPLVKEAFRLVASGMPLRAVLLKLRELGLRGPRGGDLCLSTLQHMVRNPFYAGRFRNGNRTLEGKHPALVDEKMLAAVRSNLRKRRTF